jgi:dihydropteroate synthase
MAEQIRLGLQGFARVPRRTRVMGILNVTPDSFSDGGKAFDPFKALDQALQMQAEGADLIDIGGESTRPGARGVSAEEEIKRVIPVLQLLSKKIKIPLSIDTTKAEVARRAVGQGVSLVNDISALQGDPRMAETLKRLGVPVVLMHMKGRPRTMQRAPRYGEVITEIMTFFRFRVRFALEKGIPLKNLILDPGFGFGKTPWHNIELTRRLWEFKILGLPLMFAPSRKATLGVLTGGLPPDERLESTAAAVTAGILAGADFVRVHDVQSMVRVVKIADAIRNDRGLTRP